MKTYKQGIKKLDELKAKYEEGELTKDKFTEACAKLKEEYKEVVDDDGKNIKVVIEAALKEELEATKKKKATKKESDDEDDDDLEEAKKSSKKESDDDDDDDDDDEDDDDIDEDDDKKKKKKIDEDFDASYTEDLQVLIESESGLTEEFQTKAKVLFDTAVKSRIRQEKERLEEEYETRINEEANETREWLIDQIDGFLTEAVESWAEENKVAIESSLRTELTEDFISGLKKLFEEHYIDVPESKRDILEETEKKYSELLEKSAEVSQAFLESTDTLNKFKRDGILNEAADGLSVLQKEKFRELVEDIEYVDEETFASKVEIIRDAYFKGANIEKKPSTKNLIEEEGGEFNEDLDGDDIELSPKMQRYISTMKRTFAKK
jgi:hypothetical protein